jgi:hypothetical protein
MTAEQKIIRAKVGLLELAKQLCNVSQACKMMDRGGVGASGDMSRKIDRAAAMAIQEMSLRAALDHDQSGPPFAAMMHTARGPGAGPVGASRPWPASEGAGRHPDCSAPRLGSRFAVGTRTPLSVLANAAS